eukprot:722247-Alexandrium_andersonii.AAC.1
MRRCPQLMIAPGPPPALVARSRALSQRRGAVPSSSRHLAHQATRPLGSEEVHKQGARPTPKNKVKPHVDAAQTNSASQDQGHHPGTQQPAGCPAPNHIVSDSVPMQHGQMA